ncbi:MAG: antitoxin VbhA family protein [Candidatus Accumulibacter sp.]|jgi:hypothetical protein|nr:antitoxin VbhA family protein [Accumulibacter sp.]
MTFNKEQRRDAVEQATAILALEGFERDEKHDALLERYINGELTLEQVDALSDAELAERRRAARLKTA